MAKSSLKKDPIKEKILSSKKINSLKKYFKEKPQISMAFLFGSQIKGLSRKTSDWDIGIYKVFSFFLKEIKKIL